MLGFVKMSVLSAVLSFGVVTAYNHAGAAAQAPVPAKPFQDRLPAQVGPAAEQVRLSPTPVALAPAAAKAGKGDRLPVAADGNCASQTWPTVSLACLSRDDGLPKPSRVRIITVETRDEPNTSVLVRMPHTDVARR
jgi:hypothetical protein